MKQFLFPLFLVSALLGAPAAPAADLRLPPFEAIDVDAQPVGSGDLQSGEQWLLAVVDGGLPSARRFLDALGSKNERFGGNVVVLVLGSQAQFDTLRQAYERLGDLRWLRSQSPTLLGELGLTGGPARIALHPDGRIASRRAGLGRSPDEVARQVRAWVGSTGAVSIDDGQ